MISICCKFKTKQQLQNPHHFRQGYWYWEITNQFLKQHFNEINKIILQGYPFDYGISIIASAKCICTKAIITDTLSISLQQAEIRFLDSNFLLLASHYNVDAQKALVEQAKLWDNPTLNLDKVISANGQFLPHGKILMDHLMDSIIFKYNN